MTQPGRLDLTIYIGQDFAEVFTWLANNIAVNLTGYEWSAQVKAEDGTLLATFTVTNNSPATDGKIKLALAAADSAEITEGTHNWDLRYKATGLQFQPLLIGQATAIPYVSVAP